MIPITETDMKSLNLLNQPTFLTWKMSELRPQHYRNGASLILDLSGSKIIFALPQVPCLYFYLWKVISHWYPSLHCIVLFVWCLTFQYIGLTATYLLPLMFLFPQTFLFGREELWCTSTTSCLRVGPHLPKFLGFLLPTLERRQSTFFYLHEDSMDYISQKVWRLGIIVECRWGCLLIRTDSIPCNT
jgi:hypothetical protein